MLMLTFMRSTVIGAIIAAFSGLAAQSQAQSPIETYGALPSLRSLQLTPNGERFGYLINADNGEGLVIFDPETNSSMGFGTGDLKTQSISFPNNRFAILNASFTDSNLGRANFEQGVAFAYNIKKDKVVRLLSGTPEVLPRQSIGTIVGVMKGKDEVFMPAYIGERGDLPRRNLMRVNLATGRGKVHRTGLFQTRDWFVDTDGKVIAREDFDDEKNIFKILVYKNNKAVEIYREESTSPTVSVVGIKPDRKALIVSILFQGNEFSTLHEMDFSGDIGPAIFRNNKADTFPITDRNRFMIGVGYSGLYPSYKFFDNNRTVLFKQIQDAFPGLAVTLIDYTDDFRKLIINVEGGLFAPTYFMYDAKNNAVVKIANTYNLKDDEVGDVATITYKARDGLSIPAVLTRPVGWDPDKKYPLIALPHGGPEAYDSVGFDWWSQYFASRGYIVLQPNFRGSTGFGWSHRIAGRGKWGLEMQDDISDGILALDSLGWIDRDRVCIMGASYGGYAALAGGAFSPDLYQCVVAVSPVSDLPKMLAWEKRDSGANSSVNDYWRAVIGDRKEDADRLIATSPARNADKFQAPVLLIHGNDDTVVPIIQSEYMEDALKKADKPVKFLRQKTADHWLSTSETRLETLQAIADFVEETIGEK